MMLRAVVAMPSATLSATSLRPGYLAASSSLKPLARASSEPTPGIEVMSATSPSALPYFSMIAWARPSAAMRPPWTLSVVKNDEKAFESAAESMPMIGTFLAASSIGLPSALNSVGEMTIAAGFSATAFSRIEIWPLMSDSDCAPSSGTLTPRSLPALRAPASTICQ